MWPAKQPIDTVEDVIRECAAGIQNADMKGRLLNSLGDMSANNVRYQADGSSSRLHTVTRNRYRVSELSDDELKWLYDNRLGKSGDTGAGKIRGRLLISAPDERCCYCQQSIATTLDHFVPKTVIPGLAIDPWNLVPCCQECNHKMGSAYGTSAAEEMLHPYFWPKDVGRWLYANASVSTYVDVTFYSSPDSGLPDALRERMAAEFEQLELATKFKVLAAKELRALRGRYSQMARTLSKMGLPTSQTPDFVRANLLESAEERERVDENDLFLALYKGLAESNPYCSGGYLLVG